MKYRADRRHGMPIVPIGLFHQAGGRELEEDQDLRPPGLAGLADRPQGVKNGIEPLRIHGSRAVALVDGDLGKLALFAETAGGEAALDKRRGEDIARALGHRRPKSAAGRGGGEVRPTAHQASPAITSRCSAKACRTQSIAARTQGALDRGGR